MSAPSPVGDAACMIWPAIRAASALPPLPAFSSITQTAETGLPFLSSAKPMNQPWSGRLRRVLGGAGLAADRVAVDLGALRAGAVLDHADHHVLQVAGDLRR